MNKLFSILFLTFIASFSVFGQKKTKLPCIDKEFSIVVHVVKDSLGNKSIEENDILTKINQLNPIFDSICVSFKVCEFRYIENFRYDSINKAKNQYDELLNQYHVPFRINVFYVDHIIDPANAAGFADLGFICRASAKDSVGGIVIKKSQNNIRVLAHEFGHYFGLNHTWHNNQNLYSKTLEYANGSNSSTTGDEILDTPADPFIKDTDPTSYLSKNPSYPCKFIGKMQDVNGNFYDPLVGNIMSYYPDYCDCGFTHDQYKKMANTFLSNPKMW